MALGTDGEKRSPTGSLFDAKENGGADFQCRAVDHRFPAQTQAGRPFTLRVVRESFNRRVIGLMTHTTGTNSCPIVSVGTSGDRRCTTGVVHFDIVRRYWGLPATTPRSRTRRVAFCCAKSASTRPMSSTPSV